MGSPRGMVVVSLVHMSMTCMARIWWKWGPKRGAAAGTCRKVNKSTLVATRFSTICINITDTTDGPKTEAQKLETLEIRTMDHHTALTRLQEPALHDLSILSISEPILNVASQTTRSPSKRYSNADKISQTPASLAADLVHYQELFSKLRFSYVEQVTKERFLRAVTAEQPDFVTAGENAELEERLRGDKSALKQKKQEVREIISALEEQGRQLARSKGNNRRH